MLHILNNSKLAKLEGRNVILIENSAYPNKGLLDAFFTYNLSHMN